MGDDYHSTDVARLDPQFQREFPQKFDNLFRLGTHVIPHMLEKLSSCQEVLGRQAHVRADIGFSQLKASLIIELLDLDSQTIVPSQD